MIKAQHCWLTIEQLCLVYNKRPQTYYGIKHRQHTQKIIDTGLIELVKVIRNTHPGYGLRKLHYCVKRQGFNIGRDKLRQLLKESGMMFKAKRRFTIRTTNSRHNYHLYPNLLKSIDILYPEQVWVADITCIRVGGQYCFLALVSDARSRKIMGWDFANQNTSELACKALKAAWENRFYDNIIIHHSDRGTQYCCNAYRLLLQHLGFKISTTESGDPRENAIAERIFGTLKKEYGLNRNYPNEKIAKKNIAYIIEVYNNLRIHYSCGLQTPAEQHLITI